MLGYNSKYVICKYLFQTLTFCCSVYCPAWDDILLANWDSHVILMEGYKFSGKILYMMKVKPFFIYFIDFICNHIFDAL